MTLLENFATGHLNLEGIPDNTPDKEKAFYLGERLGCPVVPTLVEERGAENMAHRYAEVIFYYGYILDTLARKNPSIAKEISEQIIREEDEKLAGYDEGWVPEWNKQIIPGTETPWGYALPRLLISYATDKHGFTESKQEVWVRALLVLDEVADNLEASDTANEFLVKFAEALTETGADPKIILAKTMSAGKLRQDTVHRRFAKIAAAMAQHAPTLWAVYEGLSSEEKSQLGIADV